LFDTASLQAELAGMLATEWVDHYNTTVYDSGWQCIPLRSVGGRLNHILAIDSDAYAPTPILERSPQFQRVLAQFDCELLSVRLMSLAPGAVIRPHRDPATGYEDGVARLHIPIHTDPAVLFHIDGEPVHFAQGDTWYLNANCLHGVENHSTLNRVHLAIDCVPNAWLGQVFERAGYVAPLPMKAVALHERALLRGEEVAHATLVSMRGWYPVLASLAPPQLLWRELGQRRFTEPFFGDTLHAASRRRCGTSFEPLADFDDVIAPSAFIFHVSRCGSTLLTQALATLAHCVVLSEPPVIDSFLRTHGPEPLDAAKLDLLRLLVGALGQRRSEAERALVIKFDSWHIHSLGTIRQVFPHTPCFFIYREPEAVMASHRRQRGPQMVPGAFDAARLKIGPHALAPGDLDGYCRLVLEGFYTSALEQAESHGLILLNYNQLPAAIGPDLLERMAIGYDDAGLAAMRERTRFHSKNGSEAFGGDPQAAPPQAGPHLAAAYAALERLRLKAGKTDSHDF
jgi:quercetin dioxygenase-like cupin family protein